MKSLNELNRDISAPLNVLEANRLCDLRSALTEIANAFENRDEQFEEGDIAQSRLRLAVAGLRLSQITVPALEQIGQELMQLAGGAAVQMACKPTRALSGREIPSTFTVPSEFRGIVDKAKAAVQSIAGK